MDSKPFLTETFINNRFLLPALFDSGYLPYVAFSEYIVKKQKLPRIPIEDRKLLLAKNDTKSHKISHIKYVILDIKGRRECLWGYVIKNLHCDLIVGKAWAERNTIIYDANGHSLYINQGEEKFKRLE